MTPWEQLKTTVLTTNQVRSVDRIAVEQYSMNSLVLMENAALGCVRWLENRFDRPPRTVILCGRGNNGGDGLVIARHLRVLGWHCSVILLGPPEQMAADARANLTVLLAEGGQGVTVSSDMDPSDLERIEAAELVIDSMLGTGAKGSPRKPMDAWIDSANRSLGFRLAIDVPTGVDAESGKVETPAFCAGATLTFVARKPAMERRDAKRLFGDIEVLPIGIPDTLIRQILAP